MKTPVKPQNVGIENETECHWWTESEIVDTLRAANQRQVAPETAFSSFTATHRFADVSAARVQRKKRQF